MKMQTLTYQLVVVRSQIGISRKTPPTPTTESTEPPTHTLQNKKNCNRYVKLVRDLRSHAVQQSTRNCCLLLCLVNIPNIFH